MDDVVIRVEGLGKRYRIGTRRAGYSTLRDSVTGLVSMPLRLVERLLRRRTGGVTGTNDEIWAVEDVSFEVRRGEVVGIIGRNGAGKSTLLKILSRITEPTEGRAEIHGRVGSLLEVGTGFHPELTGRENIYLNGAIMGMRRAEIDQKFDEIVAFSEISRFIDTPVKRYSSGMYIRLAFAVAAHLEQEILVVDEVLAVGDYKFQEKCLDKMKEVTGQGRTILFVSHNLKAIAQICPRVVLLQDGQIIRDGEAASVIREYTGGTRSEVAEVAWTAERAPGDHVVKLLGVHIRDNKNGVRSEFKYTEPIAICVTFMVLDDSVDLYLRMYLENEDGVDVLVTTALENPRYDKGIHEATYTIAPHFLNEGRYAVQQVLFKEGSITSRDVARVDYPVSFSVDYSEKFAGGVMQQQPGVVRPDWDWLFSYRDGTWSGQEEKKHMTPLESRNKR